MTLPILHEQYSKEALHSWRIQIGYGNWLQTRIPCQNSLWANRKIHWYILLKMLQINLSNLYESALLVCSPKHKWCKTFKFLSNHSLFCLLKIFLLNCKSVTGLALAPSEIYCFCSLTYIYWALKRSTVYVTLCMAKHYVSKSNYSLLVSLWPNLRPQVWI